MWLASASALLLLQAASVAIGGGDVRSADRGDANASHSARSTRNLDLRFQASLWWDRDEAPLCGAAVIDERNLVTAGHCIFDGFMRPTRRPINFLRITVGNVDYQKATSYEVGYTYTHSYFNTLGVDNDIAVVRLRKPIKLGEDVRSIPLATGPPAPGTVCQLSGWGSWANADDGGPLTCSGELVGVVIRNGRKGLGIAVTDVSLYADFVAESVAHPGRGAWPFVDSLLAGTVVAAACLTVTAALARMSGAR